MSCRSAVSPPQYLIGKVTKAVELLLVRTERHVDVPSALGKGKMCLTIDGLWFIGFRPWLVVLAILAIDHGRTVGIGRLCTHDKETQRTGARTCTLGHGRIGIHEIMQIVDMTQAVIQVGIRHLPIQYRCVDDRFLAQEERVAT